MDEASEKITKRTTTVRNNSTLFIFSLYVLFDAFAKGQQHLFQVTLVPTTTAAIYFLHYDSICCRKYPNPIPTTTTIVIPKYSKAAELL